MYSYSYPPPLVINSEVKPTRLDDDIETYSQSRIKNLNYASCTELVRMVKILRYRRPEALVQACYCKEATLLDCSPLSAININDVT